MYTTIPTFREPLLGGDGVRPSQVASVVLGDTGQRPTPINRICEPVLVELYRKGYPRHDN